MFPIITDPAFYYVAIPAVILVGLAKGGFGGALVILGVPLMALTISPVQAAAIFMPILIVMDIVSLWTWRGQADVATLKRVLPGGLIGVGIGWFLAAQVSVAAIKLIVGLVAVLFALRYIQQKLMKTAEEKAGQNAVKGTFWGTVAGFTSFVAHSGAPPYQVYAMPIGHSPAVFAATSTVFFASLNALKLTPYFFLGQFNAANLATSAILLPLAPLATLAGAWLVRRIDPKLFYPLMYGVVMLVGIKLIYDGVLGL